ncbi:MAG: clan AA aspartic protease [Verrucomicrobiae bacterium]|nr:clan AA aspartic protease [Verrucomicrobiae bacterium]MCP5543438.1 clan AA aspartic protease [Akkermansiaceae bacterium]MCP5546778.1 clan AA aspartic protease [Akkermansiaceae bacterium]
MKTPIVSQLFAACAAGLLLALPAFAKEAEPSEYRDFKNSAGTVIQAVLIDKTDTEAQLLLRNGKKANVKLSDLSEDDQEYVKSWSKEKAVFIQQCRRLTIRQCLELRGYESFPFRFENNSIFVDAKINGKPANLLIDTGAGTSLLHVPYAQGVGLEVGPMDEKIYGVAGEAPAGWTPVPTLQLGEAVFRDRKILATDLMNGKPEGVVSREDGILGAEFMSKLDAVISYPERRIFLRPDQSDDDARDGAEGHDFRIFKTKDGKVFRGKVVEKTPTVATIQGPNGKKLQFAIDRFRLDDMEFLRSWSEEGALFLEHCQGLTVHDLLKLRKYQSFQFERRGNHIFVDGTLNGNDVTYMIDTGADNSLLNLSDAKENNCKVGPMDEFVWGIGGKAPAAVCMIDKLTLGDAILTNRKVLATDMTRDGKYDHSGYVGLFGADFMRELDAVITYTENRIFLIQR